MYLKHINEGHKELGFFIKDDHIMVIPPKNASTSIRYVNENSSVIENILPAGGPSIKIGTKMGDVLGLDTPSIVRSIENLTNGNFKLTI